MCFKTMRIFFLMNNFSIWNWNSCWIGMNSWDCSCEIRAANPNWVNLRIFTSALLRSLWKLTIKTGMISTAKLFRSPTHLRSNLISYEIKLIDWNSSLWDWLECLKVGEKKSLIYRTGRLANEQFPSWSQISAFWPVIQSEIKILIKSFSCIEEKKKIRARERCGRISNHFNGFDGTEAARRLSIFSWKKLWVFKAIITRVFRAMCSDVRNDPIFTFLD